VPTFDPAIRGTASTGSLGGGINAAVPKPSGTVNGDFVLVCGVISTGPQINPPDGTWTRINGVVSDYQAFWKIANNEPATWNFSWAGNHPFTFNSFSVFSQGGGTVSLDLAAFAVADPATQITSAAVTPTSNALVLVDYIQFVFNFIGAPIGPGGLTQILSDGGIGSQTDWAGWLYVQGANSSGTFIAKNNGGDPGSTWHWDAGTFSLTSSLSNTAQPPLLTDEAIFTPTATAVSDILFRSCSKDSAPPFFTGSFLTPLQPAGVQSGDLLIAHIWSNGTIPGDQFPSFSGPGAFQAIPVGWTFLPNSYLENRYLQRSASWIFYKIATGSEPPSYQWKLPAPTFNFWTVVIYDLVHVDPVTIFNGFKAATGGNGSPRAPSLTPDWRNDVSLLLFAETNPPGTPAWPSTPNAPPGYILLCDQQNQGEWQSGYLGTPNACSPVPDVFEYTEAQQTAQFMSVRYRNGWFAYSFLLKNVNVVGQSCGTTPQAPPPLLPPSAGGGPTLYNNRILLRYMGTSKGFSLLTKLPGDALIITLREVQTPVGGTGAWPLAGNGDAVIMALTDDARSYILFAGTQDGTTAAVAVTQPLPTPSDIPEEYWDTDKQFDYIYAEGTDIANFMISFSTDEGATFNSPQSLTKEFKIGIRGKSLVIKLSHSVATNLTPLLSHLKLAYNIIGKTVQ